VRTLAALLVAVVAVAAADAAGPRGRGAALLALDDRDPETRRLAAAELAEHGVMADVPRLVEALRDADPRVRAIAERGLWEVWSRSGDAEIDRLLAIGVEQMTERRGEAAVDTFTLIIDRRPEFAEGWNKRATVLYLMGEYDRSLADCDEVMKRNPHHFGALSGYGMIYLKLGDPARALPYFERALAVNPNLTQVEQTVEMLRRLLIERRKDTI
jgi:tetratricopeptide (TPR) repeat protein